jgi:hypothetical protein
MDNDIVISTLKNGNPGFTPYPQFRQSENIEDRRNAPIPSTLDLANMLKAQMEPYPLDIPQSPSPLAKELGYNKIPDVVKALKQKPIGV